MAIIVHSPHDGQSVKVRDQDLERAIRDSEGRIFYAVKRTDGQGYYGAFTRKGSQKDEQRYLAMIEKTQRAREVGAERSAQQIHDATGRRSSPGVLRWLVWLIVLAGIAAGVWYWLGSDNPIGGFTQRSMGEPTPDTTDNTHHEGVSDNNPSATAAESSQAPPVQGALRDGVDETPRDAQGYVGTSSGMRYTILRAGTGETAVAGLYVRINYIATTLAGQQVDASDPDRPVGFVLWSGQAPRGWDEGVAGMRVGEKRRLVLPPDLMYGRYPGRAPLPDTTLRFDIELVGVLPGVRYTTESPGDGTIARPGDTVWVHYHAYIGKAQTPYDSTYDRGAPIEFRIGAGQVIPGWELGVIGMAQGERRTIEIPPYLGYGDRGAAGVIPPGATLRYTIELVKVSGPASRHADVGLNHAG